MFEAGQKVLCIDDVIREGAKKGQKHPRVTTGNLYTIKAIFQGKQHHSSGALCASLYEVVNASYRGDDVGFYADRFRPIDDPALEIFREMTRKPVQEKEDQV